MSKCEVCQDNPCNTRDPLEAFDLRTNVFYVKCINCRATISAEDIGLVAYGRTAALLDRIAELEKRVASIEERLPQPDEKIRWEVT